MRIKGKGTRIIIQLVLVMVMVDACLGAVGGACDSSCTGKLNCCNDQTQGLICFNTTTSDCTANVQVCAKGLSLCGTQCYDGSIYDCSATSKLCPNSYQMCGPDQCYDPSQYACISGTQLLKLNSAAVCGNIGYNTSINECVNGTVRPIRPSTPCSANQNLCGKYCFDPTLYYCAPNDNLTAVDGFCGQGEVWCSVKCYSPLNYTCTNGALTQWSVGQACPSGQSTCGQVCYNPALNLVCTPDLVVCPAGQGVCNYTCYNTSRYDCVNNEIVMHPGYCDTGLGLCGSRCYNMSMYSCSNDLLIPTGVVGCNNSPCPSGASCCSDNLNDTYCYDATYYDCISNEVDPPQLCAKGLSLCGIECYDRTEYSCYTDGSIGVLCPIGLSYCTSNGATGCYDKSQYTCLPSATLCPIGATVCNGACVNIDKYTCNSSSIVYVVCPKGQSICAGTCYTAGGKLQCLNHTLVEVDNPTCPDGDCNGTCYITSRAYCVDDVVVPMPQCDDPYIACYTQCIDPSKYECDDNVAYVKCTAPQDRCNQTCFNPDGYNCVNGVVQAQPCADRGLSACNTVCYNSTTQTCTDGTVYSLCPTGQLVCGPGGCYNPANQTCVGDVIGPLCNGNLKVCCSNCYNPSTQNCNNCQVHNNSASLPTLSASLLLLLILCTMLLL